MSCRGLEGYCGVDSPNGLAGTTIGVVALAGACLAWALDNNLTQRLSVRDPVGIVRVKTTGFNQDRTVVLEFTRTFMVYKRGSVPSAVTPFPPQGVR